MNRDQNWRDIFSRICRGLFPAIREGESFQWWCAPAWYMYEVKKIRCAPLGLHLLLRWIRALIRWLYLVGYPDGIYRERERWVQWERKFWMQRWNDERLEHGLTKQESLNAESRGYADGWNGHVRWLQTLHKMREELKRRGD